MNNENGIDQKYFVDFCLENRSSIDGIAANSPEGSSKRRYIILLSLIIYKRHTLKTLTNSYKYFDCKTNDGNVRMLLKKLCDLEYVEVTGKLKSTGENIYKITVKGKKQLKALNAQIDFSKMPCGEAPLDDSTIDELYKEALSGKTNLTDHTNDLIIVKETMTLAAVQNGKYGLLESVETETSRDENFNPAEEKGKRGAKRLCYDISFRLYNRKYHKASANIVEIDRFTENAYSVNGNNSLVEKALREIEVSKNLHSKTGEFGTVLFVQTANERMRADVKTGLKRSEDEPLRASLKLIVKPDAMSRLYTASGMLLSEISKDAAYAAEICTDETREELNVWDLSGSSYINTSCCPKSVVSFFNALEEKTDIMEAERKRYESEGRCSYPDQLINNLVAGTYGNYNYLDWIDLKPYADLCSRGCPDKSTMETARALKTVADEYGLKHMTIEDIKRICTENPTEKTESNTASALRTVVTTNTDKRRAVLFRSLCEANSGLMTDYENGVRVAMVPFDEELSFFKSIYPDLYGKKEVVRLAENLGFFNGLSESEKEEKLNDYTYRYMGYYATDHLCANVIYFEDNGRVLLLEDAGSDMSALNRVIRYAALPTGKVSGTMMVVILNDDLTIASGKKITETVYWHAERYTTYEVKKEYLKRAYEDYYGEDARTLPLFYDKEHDFCFITRSMFLGKEPFRPFVCFGGRKISREGIADENFVTHEYVGFDYNQEGLSRITKSRTWTKSKQN